MQQCTLISLYAEGSSEVGVNKDRAGRNDGQEKAEAKLPVDLVFFLPDQVPFSGSDGLLNPDRILLPTHQS